MRGSSALTRTFRGRSHERSFWQDRPGCVTTARWRFTIAMSEPVVLVAKEGGIATVTLNRPEKLNALNRELRTDFCRVMQELRDDPEAQVVIITGAGRAFCAGLDLRELGEDAKTEKGALVRDGTTVSFITVIEDMSVPVLAAVNGFAV